MQRYIRAVDKMKRAYAIECGAAVVGGDVHAHALESNGEVGKLYRLPYNELELVGAVYLSHNLEHWLASDDRILPNGEKTKTQPRKSTRALPLKEAVVMCRTINGNNRDL